MALYSRVLEAMSGPVDGPPAAAPPQRQHFAADLDRTVLAYAGPEYVVYAVFRCVFTGPSSKFQRQCNFCLTARQIPAAV